MNHQAEFLTFFIRSEPDLRAFIGSVVRDSQTRDDVFQNVALTLWEKFGEYDRSRSFGAWARGVAARKILHECRSQARFPTLFPPETIQAVLEAYDRTEPTEAPRRQALQHCLEKLPSRPREVMALHYDQDLSGESIALRLGSSAAAIHQTLSRTRVALAECIERRLSQGSSK